MRTNLHHLIEQSATTYPGRPALSFKDTTLTYSQLWSRVQAVASGLGAIGLNRDDRVGIYLDKRIETIEAVFGTSASGGVFVPVNHILKGQQVGYILGNCGVRILITTSDRLALLTADLGDTVVEKVILVDDPSDLPRADGYSVTTWSSMIAAGEGAARTESAAIDIDMASILYTSGSTGKPKGVVLSHRNMIVGAESVSSYLGNTADDVILSVLPLSFDAGFSQLTTAFSVGAHVVLHNYFLPADVIKVCAKHGVTGLTCVPPLWLQIVDLDWPADAAGSLRYFANTGGRMPRATLDKLRAIFPQALPFLMYGLTEAFRSTYLDPSEVDRRPDSIGKAIPNAEIIVARPDGTRCAPHEEGELVHRGALVAMGYWGDPERTAERFKPAPVEGADWKQTELAVWSGDRVIADEEGFLFFVGRKDEMIKTSGYRVSPTEIEEVAYGTGLVRDVVALGVDDARLGQKIVLLATGARGSELDAKALQVAMRRELPLYMVPSEIVVREELPRSPNGKFDRNLIKQEFAS